MNTPLRFSPFSLHVKTNDLCPLIDYLLLRLEGIFSFFIGELSSEVSQRIFPIFGHFVSADATFLLSSECLILFLLVILVFSVFVFVHLFIAIQFEYRQRLKRIFLATITTHLSTTTTSTTTATSHTYHLLVCDRNNILLK